MKASIKNKIALISPHGFLDSSNVENILSIQEVDELVNSDIVAIFISLREVSSFNIPAVSYLCNLFTHKIHPHKSIASGFCDYTPTQYDFLLKYIHDIPSINLLSSRSHVRTIYSDAKPELQTIYFWHTAAEQRGLLIFTLLERGLNAIAVKSREELPSNEDSKIPQWINFHIAGTSNRIKNFTQSNVVFYIFSHFLDSEKIEGFNMTEFSHYLRAGFRFFALDFTAVIGINTHALRFLKTLAQKTHEKGGKLYIIGVNTSKVFSSVRTELIDAGYTFKNSVDHLLNDTEISSVVQVSQETTAHKLSKKTISSLGTILDATMQTMETMTQQTAHKKSASLKLPQFNSLNGEYIGASIAFFGELEGIILLVFEKEIARQGAAVLLGDSSLSDTDVIDSIAELANITMGKTKTALAAHQTTVNATLPRTLSSLGEIVENFDHKEGIFVEFAFGENTFIFFLTL